MLNHKLYIFPKNIDQAILCSLNSKQIMTQNGGLIGLGIQKIGRDIWIFK